MATDDWRAGFRRALIDTFIDLGYPDYYEYAGDGDDFLAYVRYVGIDYEGTELPNSWDDFMDRLHVALKDGTRWTWQISRYRQPGDFILWMAEKRTVL